MYVVPRQPGSGALLSKIVSICLNLIISTHWNEFIQNRCFFAILMNIDSSKYFHKKCGGFLKLTRHGTESSKAGMLTFLPCFFVMREGPTFHVEPKNLKMDRETRRDVCVGILLSHCQPVHHSSSSQPSFLQSFHPDIKRRGHTLETLHLFSRRPSLNDSFHCTDVISMAQRRSACLAGDLDG
jgi:hypothetical protein